ncbi:Mediator of RNA polymerase II transcription subunit 22-like protein [Elsinoe fawcettii]|nr:Mediator of RNA polymerase II transcription subunit 22-like protein [Elsinoe fawcettii]
MDGIPRNTPALFSKIDSLRNSLIKRFENLIELASIEKTDRNTTALHEYQMQVETTGLVRAAEEILALIRQLQELWLFGQLNTLEVSDMQEKVDTQAQEVALLLKQLTEMNGQQKQELAA